MSNEAVLRVTGGDFARPVLARVIGMLIARADCPIDALDDALLISDAIAAHAPGLTDGSTEIRVSTTSESLEISLGPLDEAAAQRFVQSSTVPDVGNVIERVSDSVSHSGDTLRISLLFET